MSSDLHPTRRTRIHPKGLQSPLEQELSTPQRQIGANNGSLCRYICSTLFLKPLLFEHEREAHSTKCMGGVFSEVRRRHRWCQGASRLWPPRSPRGPFAGCPAPSCPQTSDCTPSRPRERRYARPAE